MFKEVVGAGTFREDGFGQKRVLNQTLMESH